MQTEERTNGQWWVHREEMITVPLEPLRRRGVAAYQKLGASEEDAAFLFDVNLDKALQGDHARGLVHVPDFIRDVRRGAIDLRPKIQVISETTATALVDGGPKAAGRLVCKFAMDLAIGKAREHGVGWVSAQAQGSMLTPYIARALDAGMVAIIMTQSIPTVAPFGGIKPIFGNAPVAFAVPARRFAPVLVDMSLTETSAIGVALAAAQGDTLPPGFLIDRDGNASINPDDFYDPDVTRREGRHIARGSLLPLGGGHKGYALVFMVSLLSAALSKTDPAWMLSYDNPKRGRFGTVFLAIDPGAFMPHDVFLEQVDAFIEYVKRSPRKGGIDEILYPGERSQELKRRRKEAGQLNLPASHYRAFVAAIEELGV